MHHLCFDGIASLSDHDAFDGESGVSARAVVGQTAPGTRKTSSAGAAVGSALDGPRLYLPALAATPSDVHEAASGAAVAGCCCCVLQ